MKPLQFKPFENLPELAQIESEFGRNVSNGERVLSGIVGAALSLLSLRGGILFRLGSLAASGFFLHRAATGRCKLYEGLGMDSRHPDRPHLFTHATKVEASVDIACGREELYEFWRDLGQLPRVMRHVKSVLESKNVSHWEVRGPLGLTLRWDAEIVNDRPGQIIEWKSVEGSSIAHEGSVRFEQAKDKKTRVKVSFEYEPPAGKIGAMFAQLIGSSPQADLEEDLEHFKEFAEHEWPARRF